MGYSKTVLSVQHLESSGPTRTLFSLPFVEVWYAPRDKWYTLGDNDLYVDCRRFPGSLWHVFVRVGYLRILFTKPDTWRQALSVLGGADG